LGGFERFADVLADDYAIGEAVAELGLKVAVPPMLLTHACADTSLGELWRHHLRWSATIRAVAPKRHAGSGVTHAMAFGLLTVPFLPGPGLALTATALAVRLLVAINADRIGHVRQGLIWLLPLADALEFAVFVTGLVTRKIDWRGRELRIMGRGRIAQRNSSASDHS
jgi:ceramide glucosyltransferase